MPETEKKEQTPAEEQLSPKKKRAMLEYMGIMFAVAFLLVAVSLIVKMHFMQDDLQRLYEILLAIENPEEPHA